MASNVKIEWTQADERGIYGRVLGGGRKIVRLDNGAYKLPSRLAPALRSVQECSVTHDTAPGQDGRGVMFVLPVAPPLDKERARQQEAEAAKQAVADEVAEKGGAHREWAKTFLAEWARVPPCRVALEDGMVRERDICGPAEAAVAVLPRPDGASPRGRVSVKLGDTIVQFDFATGKPTAFQVTGFTSQATGGSYYDKDVDDWVHVYGDRKVAVGEPVPVPAGAPGFVRGEGRILWWEDVGEDQGGWSRYYGRSESDTVVAMISVAPWGATVLHVAGWACNTICGATKPFPHLSHSRETGEKVWGAIRSGSIPGPWSPVGNGWARMVDGVPVAYIDRSRQRVKIVAGEHVPGHADLNCETVAKAIVCVDEASGWPTTLQPLHTLPPFA